MFTIPVNEQYIIDILKIHLNLKGSHIQMLNARLVFTLLSSIAGYIAKGKKKTLDTLLCFVSKMYLGLKTS